MKFLTLRETKAFFRKVTSERDKILFLLAYHHGLRVSEVCSIRLVDIELTQGRIFCKRKKGSLSGYQVLSAGEITALSKYLMARDSKSPFLFPGRSGPLSRKTCDKLVKNYGVQAKLPKSKRHMHVWKHTIAVHLLSGGADIKLVQELLGHKNIQNTMVYASLVSRYRDDRQRELFESGAVLDVGV